MSLSLRYTIKLQNEELREYFCKFGSVVKSKIIFDHNTNKSKEYGFITFSNYNDVQRLLKMPKDTFKLKNRYVSKVSKISL